MAEGEQEDDAQKTEDPTPKRLEESRKKGQVPLSREVNNWVMLTTGTIVIAFLAGPVLGNLKEVMRVYIESAHSLPGSPGGFGIVLSEMYWQVLFALALPLVILVFAAIAGPLLQIGPLFAPEAIQPKLSKISPLEGFKRLFSLKSLMEFAKGILKLSVIGLVAVVLIAPYYQGIEHIVGQSVPIIMDELLALVIRLMTGILVALFIIAGIDLIFQRHQHQQKMKMTKQEVKDEYKQTEGDPHIRAKLRQLRQERARSRMIQAVPESDVVITNPTHFSVALKYDPETMEAPIVVAKGIDEIAMRIREVAKEHGIELYEAPPLARTLYDTVEIDQSIPGDLYKAVAEVISFVFRKQGKLNKR